MKIEKLIVTGVDISEYEYNYKGVFFLSCENTGCDKPHMKLDLADFESDDKLVQKVKNFFMLEEDIKTIQDVVLDKVMEKASLDSKDEHGEHFNNEVDSTDSMGTLDRA